MKMNKYLLVEGPWTDWQDSLTTTIESLQQKIQNKKQELLEEALIKKLGVMYDKENSFKRISCHTYTDNKNESFYYNDGSTDVHIITFIPDPISFGFADIKENNKITSSFKVKY